MKTVASFTVAAFSLLAIIVTRVDAVSSPYNVNHWTVDDGLPQNAVHSILQTRDGYLWFTTLDGLVRFDGVSFTVFSRSNTKGINPRTERREISVAVGACRVVSLKRREVNGRAIPRCGVIP